jgi:hypothetical protein
MNIRDLERTSIRNFLQHCADRGYFSDKDVLDYGCGKQPYRDIVVMGGGRYEGYDLSIYPASTTEGEDIQRPAIFDETWGAIVCTQVVQYVPDVPMFLKTLRALLDETGVLCITWPTNWPEVEKEDLHRFTLSGFARLLNEAGFSDIGTTPRAFLDAEGSRFYLGHGAIAWK